MRTKRLECTIECPTCQKLIYTVYAEEDSARPGIWANVIEPKGAIRSCKGCGHKGDRLDPVGVEAKVRQEII